MHRFTFWLGLVGGQLLCLSARSQFVPADVPLNNLVAERVYNLGAPQLKSIDDVTNPPAATPFITDIDASVELNYTYSREWYQVATPGGGYVSPDIVTKYNIYNVAPSVFFVIRSNLMVTAGFDYIHDQVSVDGSDTEAVDGYTPFISADEELLHLLPHVDKARNALFLGGNFAYTRAVASMSGPFTANLGYNIYSFGPSLVYIRSLVDWKDGTPGRVSFTVNPAYNYEYAEAPYGLERTGYSTVLGRVDFGITPNLYLNLAGTWVHRDSIGSNGSYSDYAYFGGGLAAKLLNQSNHLVLLRLSYNYEAFIKQFDSHEVSAQVEFHF
jgi:hypothetical protein